jgi:hypothetical protein
MECLIGRVSHVIDDPPVTFSPRLNPRGHDSGVKGGVYVQQVGGIPIGYLVIAFNELRVTKERGASDAAMVGCEGCHRPATGNQLLNSDKASLGITARDYDVVGTRVDAKPTLDEGRNGLSQRPNSRTIRIMRFAAIECGGGCLSHAVRHVLTRLHTSPNVSHFKHAAGTFR